MDKTDQISWMTVDDEIVDIAELGGSLGFLLRIAQLRAFETFFGDMGDLQMNPGEFTVLWLIWRNPGMKQGTIARSLQIKPAHMTKLVDRLVKAGLVSRTSDSEDRRVVRLDLSAEGIAFVSDRKATFLDLHQAERATLDDQEFSDLTRLLKKYIG